MYNFPQMSVNVQSKIAAQLSNLQLGFKYFPEIACDDVIEAIQQNNLSCMSVHPSGDGVLVYASPYNLFAVNSDAPPDRLQQMINNWTSELSVISEEPEIDEADKTDATL